MRSCQMKAQTNTSHHRRRQVVTVPYTENAMRFLDNLLSQKSIAVQCSQTSAVSIIFWNLKESRPTKQDVSPHHPHLDRAPCAGSSSVHITQRRLTGQASRLIKRSSHSGVHSSAWDCMRQETICRRASCCPARETASLTVIERLVCQHIY